MISEDHVTLKTAVMMLKIQRCIIRINFIFKSITTEVSYFKLKNYFTILLYLLFLINLLYFFCYDIYCFLIVLSVFITG